MRRRRYFTLLEMLIVMLLVGVVSALVSINIYRAVKEETFNSGAEKLLRDMQLSQSMMVYSNFNKESSVDVRLLLIEENGKLYRTYKILGEKAPERYVKRYDGIKEEIQGVARVIFERSNGQREDSSREEIEWLFTSPGGLMSKGCVIIYSSFESGDHPLYVQLPGYPAPLFLTAYKPLKIGDFDALEISYPPELQEKS